jgi:HrpA-like RNA helicase
MGLPTLLRKGHLYPQMGENQDFLNSQVPIEYILSWFESKIRKDPKNISDRVVIVASNVGSGKSTVMPIELYLKFKDSGLISNIIVTQPRVVTSIEIPKTIVNIPVYKNKLKLGKNIGFQTGDFTKKNIEKGILFSTIGILLQFLKIMEPEAFCKKYSVVIIDEAHDRSTTTDLVFFYLKKLINKVKLKDYPFVICTSGTMDVEKYKKYFGTETAFGVKGDSYPISDNYLEFDTTNVIKSSIDRIKKIHEEKGDRYKSDIVLFSPTNGLIRKLKKEVDDLNKEEFKDRIILPIGLDSSVFKSVENEYNYVFDNIDEIPIENLKRKLIMGTNSIETGITLETISYCIDTGLVNSLEYNPVNFVNILMVRPVTKSMAKQRRGRVGRIQEGTFYGLYSKDTFDSLQDIQFPEMITNDMTIPVLNILSSDIKKEGDKIIEEINMMDKIPDISISNSLYKLHSYGMIDDKLKLTSIGMFANKIRMLSIENILLILSSGHDLSSILDMITLSTFLTLGKQSITDNKFKYFQMTELSRKVKNIIQCDFIEFLVFFHVFKKNMKENMGNMAETIEFCKNNKISFNSMISFIEFRDNIIIDINAVTGIYYRSASSNLLDIIEKVNNNTNGAELELEEYVNKIKQIMYYSYRLNVAICVEKNKFKCLENNMLVDYFTFNADEGDYIIYDSIMIRKDMRGVYSPSFVNGISNMSNIALNIL